MPALWAPYPPFHVAILMFILQHRGSFMSPLWARATHISQHTFGCFFLTQSPRHNIGAHPATQMKLCAHTAGSTSLLQQRSVFLSFKAYTATSVLTLQHRWNFTPPLRAHSTPILQHRFRFLTLKVHAAMSVLILQDKRNFTSPTTGLIHTHLAT